MRVRRRLGRTAAVALGLMAFAPAGAWAAAAPTRYTLANGCHALQGPSGQVVAGGAGSSNPRLNTAFALLCHLQVQS